MSQESRILVLGRMPRGAEPETHRPAGVWCFVEQEEFFPSWDKRFAFPPEPLTDVHAVEHACKCAQALCADSIVPLAATVCFLAAQCWFTETMLYTYW